MCYQRTYYLQEMNFFGPKESDFQASNKWWGLAKLENMLFSFLTLMMHFGRGKGL